MIEFEHTIFILLLLSGVLNSKPPRQRWAALIILIGVLLVFIPPARAIEIPWDLVLGLMLPLLLWQNIRRTINADWRGWKSVSLWGITVLVLGSGLWLAGQLNWPGALLFGIVAASMIWRAGEPESGSSYMSQVGPLTLVFLLTEIEVAIQSPDHYLGGIFSGAFFWSSCSGIWAIYDPESITQMVFLDWGGASVSRLLVIIYRRCFGCVRRAD